MTTPWEKYSRDTVVPATTFLLNPLGVGKFLSEYWSKKPLHIPGRADKFEELFSLDRLRSHLKMITETDTKQRSDIEATDRSLKIRASYDRGATHVETNAENAMQHYDCGATLCIEGLDARDPILAALSASVKRELSFLGAADIRVYFSPDTQGFDLHFDARVATTLQIEGRKRWKYSEEIAVPWPFVQSAVGYNQTTNLPDGTCMLPPQCHFREVVLEPGDVLCLPAGCWHAAEALGYSLALNLAFSGFGTFWGPTLMSLLSTSAILRAPAPPALMESDLPDAVPASVDAFLEAGLNELLEAIGSLKRDREPLRQRWLALRPRSAKYREIA